MSLDLRCVSEEEAYFEEGSPCDAFNKKLNPPTPTNADHIRSMTDEELAAFLDAFCDSSECRAENGAVCPLYASCASYEKGFDWNVWLKQPYKEG